MKLLWVTSFHISLCITIPLVPCFDWDIKTTSRVPFWKWPAVEHKNGVDGWYGYPSWCNWMKLLVVSASWKRNASNEWYPNTSLIFMKRTYIIWNIIVKKNTYTNISDHIARFLGLTMNKNRQPTTFVWRWELWPMITTTFFTSSMMFHFLDRGLTNCQVCGNCICKSPMFLT